MKFKKPYLIAILLTALAFFLVIKYWDPAMTLVIAVLGAISPLIIGGVIAYIVNILMTAYEKLYTKWIKAPALLKFKRPISLVLAFISFVLFLFLFLALIIPELVRSVQTLLSIDPKAIVDSFSWLQNNELFGQYYERIASSISIDQTEMQKRAVEAFQQVLTGVGGVMTTLVTTVTSVFSTVVTLIISVVFSIYILSSKETLGRQIKTLLTTYVPSLYSGIKYVTDIVNDSFRNFFIGQLLEAIIVGVLCYIGMLIFKFPFSATVSVLVGFSALIPMAGAYIGAILGALMILTTSPIQALLFLVYITILQQMEGNIVYPRVVGNSIGLPGIWVLAAVTIGGSLYGIVGMLLSVPLAAALYKLLRNDVAKRKDKGEEVVVEDVTDTTATS